MLIILLEKYGTPTIQTVHEDSYSQLMWDLPEGVVKLINNGKPKTSFVQIIDRDEVERFKRFRQTWK
jgi:hypothetical protein